MAMPEPADFNRRVNRVREVLRPEPPPTDEDTEDTGPSEDTVREVQQEAEE